MIHRTPQTMSQKEIGSALRHLAARLQEIQT